MSGPYKGYMDRVVPLIIEKSDKLSHSDLTDTEKKLHSLIMVVFAFSANAIDKLDEQTKTDMMPLLKDIEDHLRQLGKIDPNI